MGTEEGQVRKDRVSYSQHTWLYMFFFLLIFVLSDNFLSLILTANAITT